MSAQTEEAATRSAPRAGKGGAPPAPGTARRRDRAVPYLLILPAAVFTVLLLGWIMVQNGLLSFQNLNRRQLIRRVTEWTGFDNYSETLGNEEFWRVTLRSVVFTGVNVVLIMAIGCLIGLLLARLGATMRLLLSFGLVLAWAMPTVAATTVFQWLFAQRFGVVNHVLDQLGWHSMADYNWTSGQFSTFFVITVLIVWQSVPFVAINLYAATTTIPKELYEAASLDGAGVWKRFTSVTFPFLKPFFFATTFLEVIWIFKAFTQVFVINEGGPDRLTETLPVYAFVEGMNNQHFGMGAAISILTILILIGLTAYYLRLVLKQEEDEL
ncbi:carbohydrate ABC transporter permease [Streptomyces sp. I05A-00742]|uniref:carbohydrate ABC transporter permease n=1 Tax=Streptomyces sp. I05A-00742 TaxID=2732853 RepID=UPI001488A921|nr:sugar ABC transporter permease [Streptomyces sp. I05A-00742]